MPPDPPRLAHAFGVRPPKTMTLATPLRVWYAYDTQKNVKIYASGTVNSGEASPTFGLANANFSVFIDRVRINF